MSNKHGNESKYRFVSDGTINNSFAAESVDTLTKNVSNLALYELSEADVLRLQTRKELWVSCKKCFIKIIIYFRVFNTSIPIFKLGECKE